MTEEQNPSPKTQANDVARRGIEQRLTDLEISISHQQRLCEQLNEVVTEHTQLLLKLRTELEDQRRQLDELREEKRPDQQNLPHERPPHY